MESHKLFIEDAEFSEVLETSEDTQTASDVVKKVARALTSNLPTSNDKEIATILNQLVLKYRPGINGVLSKQEMQEVVADLLTMTVTDISALISDVKCPIFLRIIGKSLLKDLDDERVSNTYAALERAFGKPSETKEIKQTSLKLSKDLTREDYAKAREQLL